MAWVLRGLRDGVVTSPYPRRPDGYGDGYKASVSVLAGRSGGTVDDEVAALRGLAGLCPTGAIRVEGGLRVDRGRCILCGRCVEARPDRFAFDASPEVAALERGAIVVPPEDDAAVERVGSS